MNRTVPLLISSKDLHKYCGKSESTEPVKQSYQAAHYDLSEDPMDLGKARRLWREDFEPADQDLILKGIDDGT